MDEPRAQRTLVKSPPELWAEISDAGALAGHLGAFGDIRITRLEPETTVAWEGDRARGTVELEPAGWGTKVTLTARIAAEPEAAEPAPQAAVAPEARPEAAAEFKAAVAPEAPAEFQAAVARQVAAESRAAVVPEAAPESEVAGEPEPGFAVAPAPGSVAAAPGSRAAEPEGPRRRRRWWPFRWRRADASTPAPERGASEAPARGASEEPEREAPARGAPARGEPAHAASEEPERKAPARAEPAPAEPAREEPTLARPLAPVEPEPPASSETAPASLDARRAEEILTGVLDDLGAAHHRPFSRG